MDSEKRSYSIVIPTYNSAGFIRERIADVEQAAQSVIHEIIIVNDNSDQKTAEKLNEIDEEMENVSVIHLPATSGQFTSTLVGIKHAKYDFIFTCDDDLNAGFLFSEALRQHQHNEESIYLNTNNLIRKTPWLLKGIFRLNIALFNLSPVTVDSRISSIRLCRRRFFTPSLVKPIDATIMKHTAPEHLKQVTISGNSQKAASQRKGRMIAKLLDAIYFVQHPLYAWINGLALLICLLTTVFLNKTGLIPLVLVASINFAYWVLKRRIANSLHE